MTVGSIKEKYPKCKYLNEFDQVASEERVDGSLERGGEERDGGKSLKNKDQTKKRRGKRDRERKRERDICQNGAEMIFIGTDDGETDLLVRQKKKRPIRDPC